MSQPLSGRRVVVTRAEEQAAGLARALANRGATVELLPLLEVRPLDPKLLLEHGPALRSSAWLVFTSANAVAACQPLLRLLLQDLPPALRLAALGEATRRALEESRFAVHLQPAAAHAEGLVAALVPLLRPEDGVFLPQAEDARPVLAEGLRAAGAQVHTVTTYRKVQPAGTAERFREIFQEGPLGWVTFTSPSTVQALVALCGDTWPQRRGSLEAAAIGPVTAQALRSQGVEPSAEAQEASAEGLAAALVAAVEARGVLPVGSAEDGRGGSSSSAPAARQGRRR